MRCAITSCTNNNITPRDRSEKSSVRSCRRTISRLTANICGLESSYAPSGLASSIRIRFPRLAPWALFLRRSAAGCGCHRMQYSSLNVRIQCKVQASNPRPKPTTKTIRPKTNNQHSKSNIRGRRALNAPRAAVCAFSTLRCETDVVRLRLSEAAFRTPRSDSTAHPGEYGIRDD